MFSLAPACRCSAMYGMMHITGDQGGGPVKPGVAVTDVLTGRRGIGEREEGTGQKDGYS